jgi:pectinesterase
VQLQDVVLRSFQDTLYLQSPAKGRTVRACLTGCDIEGDVDFIFGQSTAWFEDCRIRSLGSRAPQSWATAPSTDIRTRYGFVFERCDFTHDGSPAALAGRFRLGRQWFEGVRATPYGASPLPGYHCVLGPVSSYDPPVGTISRTTLDSVGKCVILRSRIGAHIDQTMPWDDWAGGAWNPRHRPALFSASDMFRHLAGWLGENGVSYADVEPGTAFLREHGNSTNDN